MGNQEETVKAVLPEMPSDLDDEDHVGKPAQMPTEPSLALPIASGEWPFGHRPTQTPHPHL